MSNAKCPSARVPPPQPVDPQKSWEVQHGHWSGRAHHNITPIQIGRQEIWLEQINRLVQNNDLPTKTDISGSNSPPLAPISIITLKTKWLWPTTQKIHKLFQD